ncbi:DUF6221 family protein [Streptomyces sp. NPDC056944]|uniref:DUF6221 family protein n=1 Tax=Streptomyces sp. NPDC056944 TaxID=3345972 RepID=UPI00363BDA1D
MTGSASVGETDRLRRLLADTGSHRGVGLHDWRLQIAAPPWRRPSWLPPHDRSACSSALPARILREVESKRRILARHARDPRPCHDLRDLASPGAGHPDFPARA